MLIDGTSNIPQCSRGLPEGGPLHSGLLLWKVDTHQRLIKTGPPSSSSCILITERVKVEAERGLLLARCRRWWRATLPSRGSGISRSCCWSTVTGATPDSPTWSCISFTKMLWALFLLSDAALLIVHARCHPPVLRFMRTHPVIPRSHRCLWRWSSGISSTVDSQGRPWLTSGILSSSTWCSRLSHNSSPAHWTKTCQQRPCSDYLISMETARTPRSAVPGSASCLLQYNSRLLTANLCLAGI